jgi:hypothetical protein
VGCHFVLCSSNFDVKICTKKVKLYYKWDKSGIPLDTLTDGGLALAALDGDVARFASSNTRLLLLLHGRGAASYMAVEAWYCSLQEQGRSGRLREDVFTRAT